MMGGADGQNAEKKAAPSVAARLAPADGAAASHKTGFLDRALDTLAAIAQQNVDDEVAQMEHYDRMLDKIGANAFLMRQLSRLDGVTAPAIDKLVIWIKDFLESSGLSDVNPEDFLRGCVQAFKDKGENIGEFFANFYSTPKETLKVIFNDAKRLINYVRTNPAEASQLGWNLTDNFFSKKIQEWEKHPEKISFDIGYITAIALISSVLIKGPGAIVGDKIGTTAMTSTSLAKIGAEAASWGIFVSSNAPNALVALKDPERTRQKFNDELGTCLHKRLQSSDKEQQEVVDQLIRFSFDSLEHHTNMVERNNLWLALIDFFHARETGKEPDFKNVKLVEGLLINSFYEIKDSVFKDNRDAGRFFKAVFTSTNVALTRPNFEKGELAKYRERASALWNDYLAGENVNNTHLYAAYESFKKGEIPAKPEQATTLALFLTGFPYYLNGKVKSDDEKQKILYALKIEAQDSDMNIMRGFSSGI